MTEDFIDATFADLDEFYPGSKRKRKPVVKKEPKAVANPNWDAKPRTITMPNGNDMEVFTIGALADALNRPIITVRTWIKDGHIPSAPYRLPSKKNRNGEDHAGKRLYSRAMIEAAVELFSKFDVLDLRRIDWSEYDDLSNELAVRWNEIRMQEIK